MELIIQYIKERKFENTVANFVSTDLTSADWERCRADVDKCHWFSPSGKSEYILVHSGPLWSIYRRSCIWGDVGNGCNWSYGGKNESYDVPKIGICDIDHFENKW